MVVFMESWGECRLGESVACYLIVAHTSLNQMQPVKSSYSTSI